MEKLNRSSSTAFFPEHSFPCDFCKFKLDELDELCYLNETLKQLCIQKIV